MASRPHWWPFCYKDFWSSPVVGMMTYPEHIVWYLKLLSDQADLAFMNRGLPVEEEYLRGLCSRAWPVDPANPVWADFVRQLDRLFPESRHGGRRNVKQDEVMGKQVATYRAKVDAAKRATQKRIARQRDDDVNDNVTQTSTELDIDIEAAKAAASSSDDNVNDNVDYNVRCVVAMNTGLLHNHRLATFREIPATTQVGLVSWEEDGIPIELAAKIVEERAATYAPTTHNPQPRSLRYFDAAVREAWKASNGAPRNPFDAMISKGAA